MVEDNEYEALFVKTGSKGKMFIQSSGYYGIENIWHFDDDSGPAHYYSLIILLKFDDKCIMSQLDEDIDNDPNTIFISNTTLDIKILHRPKIKIDITNEDKYKAIYQWLKYMYAYYSLWNDIIITDENFRAFQFVWDYLGI